MSDVRPEQLLRRTLVGGYRVADVEVLLARFRLLASQSDAELRGLRERVERLEDERAELNALIDRARLRELEASARATQLLHARENAADEADERAHEIVEAAHAEAARTHGETFLRNESARAQVDELLRLRDALSATMHGLVRDVESALARLDLRGEPAPVPPPHADEPAVPTPEVGHGTLDARIELEAGPFSDFASLSAFERALESLPRVEDVYIRRFEDGRATIDVALQEPTDLLNEMDTRLPYRLDVRSAVPDRISVNVFATEAQRS
ncbi:MAG: hypothetical protein ACRDM1_11610 [Gaiellaceae bacterium]